MQLAVLGNYTLVSAQGSTIALYFRSPFKTRHYYSISLNDARVIQTDIPASNGVIHSLDRVLFTDIWQFSTSYPYIYALILQDPNLSTLKYTLRATGLDSVLTLLGPQYTLFAPTNEAFNDPSVGPLFNYNNLKALKQVLLYHILG